MRVWDMTEKGELVLRVRKLKRTGRLWRTKNLKRAPERLAYLWCFAAAGYYSGTVLRYLERIAESRSPAILSIIDEKGTDRWTRPAN